MKHLLWKQGYSPPFSLYTSILILPKIPVPELNIFFPAHFWTTVGMNLMILFILRWNKWVASRKVIVFMLGWFTVLWPVKPACIKVNPETKIEYEDLFVVRLQTSLCHIELNEMDKIIHILWGNWNGFKVILPIYFNQNSLIKVSFVILRIKK